MKLSIVFIALVLIVAPYVQAEEKKERILGGQIADDSFPYQVSVQYGFVINFGVRHICGGSIINKRWVLSAGHCITAPAHLPLYNYYVKAGITNLKDRGGQFIKVSRSIVHPKYKGGRSVGPYDLSLLKLERELEFNQHVQPIQLPTQDEEFTGMSTISGWGQSGGGRLFPQYPANLLYIDLPLISTKECNDAVNNLDEDFFSDQSDLVNLDLNVCTGPLYGYDKPAICSGDSGGPLVVDHNDNPVQIGIVSWGTNKCRTQGAPTGVYTRVAAFVDFINNHVNSKDHTSSIFDLILPPWLI